MIHPSVSTGKQSLSVIGAILLYGQNKRGLSLHMETSTFASIHSTTEIDGVPQILPGRPITERDLAQINQGLSAAHASQSIQWLDQRILAKGADRMIWWTPPTKRPMFFQKSKHVANTFNGSAVCPVPAMVWMAIKGRGLYVFALKGDMRPTQDAKLYQAPFFNVWGKGLICSGNAGQPEEEAFWNIELWERYFFGSHFTHPNFLEKNRLVKGLSPVTFWKRMIASPTETFPVERLVAMPLTAEDLVDPLVVDKLSALPRPQGEF